MNAQPLDIFATLAAAAAGTVQTAALTRTAALAAAPAAAQPAPVTIDPTDTRSACTRAIDDSEPLECHEWSGEVLSVDPDGI